MNRIFLVLLLTLVWPVVAQENVENGPSITQEDAEAKAKDFLGGVLKDPYSAVYSWKPVYAGWWKDGLFNGGKKHVGWVLEGTVNSKNSYGGFVGNTPTVFVFHDGALIAAYIERRGRNNTRSMEKIK